MVNYPKHDIKQEPDVRKILGDRNKTKTEETFGPDVGLYEETDECDLGNSGHEIWLVKLPRFIKDRWDDIPLDSEEVIELGTVRINKHDPTVIKLTLSGAQGVNEGLPCEYELKNHLKPEVSNTFVFTEKNGAKRKLGSTKEGFPEIPRRLFWKDDERVMRKHKSGDHEKEKEDFIKIPHHPTSVIGAVIRELQMQPVLNDEYGDFGCKAQMTAKRTKSVKLLDDIAKYNMFNPGIIGSIKDKPFLKIISSGKARVRTLDKTYRISKEELQTKLFALFERYEYYSMKDLVERLRQPQAYLQEVLEEIATYNVHGTFCSKWCLRSEYRQAMGTNKTYKARDT